MTALFDLRLCILDCRQMYGSADNPPLSGVAVCKLDCMEITVRIVHIDDEIWFEKQLLNNVKNVGLREIICLVSVSPYRRIISSF